MIRPPTRITPPRMASRETDVEQNDRLAPAASRRRHAARTPIKVPLQTAAAAPAEVPVPTSGRADPNAIGEITSIACQLLNLQSLT